MVGFFTIILSLITSVQAAETRFKIAVVDTGMPRVLPRKYLCNTEQPYFSGGNIIDTDGHGTNISGIIVTRMDPKRHCFIFIKWTEGESTPYESAITVPASIKAAFALQANMVVLALEGGRPFREEYKYLQLLLNNKATVIAAAGNGGKNLAIRCDVYPACFDLKGAFYVAENWSGVFKHYSSNYNSPNGVRANGVNRQGFGVTMTGTSQATAEVAAQLLP